MKKIAFLFAVLAASVASADSYLYWMADTELEYDTLKIAKAVETKPGGWAPIGDYLTIGYLDGDSGVYTFDEYNTFLTKDQVDEWKEAGAAFYASLAGDQDYGGFVIELFKEGKFVGQAETLSTSVAANIIDTSLGGGTELPNVPWSASSFVVPEPTSGLMLLLGCAALGLRRRKVAHA